jgi:hypothetical protein
MLCAEGIKPIAAAAAAGLACANALELLYNNIDDLAAIDASRKSFEDIVYTQFGTDIPFMNGTEPWPMIVAVRMYDDRANDGSGNPKRMIPNYLNFEF